jgi:O-antigen/teichoic acid export membrane protein
MTEDSNKRIAKNTLLLYFRQILVILVSLYTVRVVLETLGVEDFGIYNVIGGLVTMMSFFSTTLASASQRFFAFELGKKDYIRLKQTFCLMFCIYSGVAILILLIAETVGLWLLNTQMNIPEGRTGSANWVYQFSILSFIVTILTIPYNAVIIAREKMNVYAYVSIIDVILKLLIVYLLLLISFDKLKLYAALTFCVTTIISLIYQVYCKRKYEECRFSFYWEQLLFKKLFAYSCWSILGSSANVIRNQGVNILLNIVFNPTINAAHTIAHYVNTAITNFTSNFFQAVRPQIIKSFSANEKGNMLQLIYKSSKISYYLLLILSLPVLLECQFIFSVWLKDIPDYTVYFTRLIIILSLIEVISVPIITSIQASGNIKRYQLIISVMQLLNLPFSYLLLKLGYPPETTLYISIFLSIVCFIPRLLISKQVADLSVSHFFYEVLFPIILVTLCSFPTPLFFHLNSQNSPCCVILLSIISSTISIYFLGLTKHEKNAFLNYIYDRFKHKKQINS